MKKFIYIAATLAIGLFAQAQNLVVVDKNGGTVKFERENIREVYFQEAPEYTATNTLLHAQYTTMDNYARYEVHFGTGEPDANGDPAEVGDAQVVLLLIGAQSADASNAVIPAGYYKAATGYSINTFNVEGSAIYTKAEDGNVGLDVIIAGTVDVRLDGGTYDIRCELQSFSGAEYDFRYTGPIAFTVGASDYKEFTEPQQISFLGGQGRFYGNWYNPFADDAHLEFYSGDFDSNGNQVEGYWLAVDIFMAKVADPMTQQQVLDGVYTVETRESVLDYTYLPNTFIRGYEMDFMGAKYPVGTYLTHIDRAGNSKLGYIKSGTITVSGSGTQFEFDLLTDNDVAITGSCTGMNLRNYCDNNTKEPKRPYSTLTGNYVFDLPEVAVAQAYNLGDFIVGGLNNFALRIGDPNQVVGDYLMLELMTAGSELADGTYNVGNTLSEKSVIVGCASAAGQPAYSWFADLDSTDDEGYQTVMAPINSGSLTIETLADGQKKFTFDFMDDNSHKLTGSWTGEITYPSLSQQRRSTPLKSHAHGVVVKNVKKPVEARLIK